MLDELLFLILKSAKSLSPVKLKEGLLKLLSTPLGKEAVLEAELELRNHREGGVIVDADCSLDKVSIEAAFDVLFSHSL